MKKTPKKTRQAGFALIVTLSLMILLTVIAVGLLTLSSISLRASSQGSATAIARSNARLAMMLALGELQTSLGVDKAVSAPASSVMTGAPQPHLTGAWTSTDPSEYWHWTPTPGGAPSFSSKKDRFSRWLVSTPTPADAEAFTFASGAAPTGKAAVTLVADLKDSQKVSTQVVAGKVKLATSQSGKYGWAVFDESTKAAIDLGDPATKQDPGIEIASRTSPNRVHADTLDEKLSSLADPVNLVSLETATIPAGAANEDEFRRRFHDFTTSSMGLLTNTAEGGLKTDLTALFEPDTLPNNAFQAPTLASPYQDAFSVNSGAPKWNYIRDHYRKYTNISSASAGESSYAVNSNKVKDLVVNTSPTAPMAPEYERLLPVIAKFQLVFSLVSHYSHLSDRVDFYNANGGNTNFGAIHLAYDPVVTLYNPYDVSINLAKTRIRIWDPPVGFRFTKIDNQNGTRSYFRAGGEFLGLARFQIANQSNAGARKCFTLVLTDGTSESAGGSLRLKPGEVKVFSPRVQKTWSWSWETSGGPNAFFDYNQGLEFGNQDYRTKNPFGVEAVPGWQPRAGLQTDHLATNNPRNDASRYQFERAANKNDGFVTMRLTDEVLVEAKPTVTAASATKQFQVDVLAGNNPGNLAFDNASTGVKQDTLRSYAFTFSGTDPSGEISADPTHPIISHQFTVGEMLQTPSDMTSEHKKPFAMLEMSARTTKGLLTDSKPWLYNNPVVEGGDQNSNIVGLSNQSYDLRLTEISSFKNFPTGISVDGDNNHGYFGASDSITDGGSAFVMMNHVPVTPAASLGDLVASNLVSSSVLPRVTHPFGNSFAHPLIPADRVTQNISGATMMDHSYLLNDALWDPYFFSSISDYVGGSGRGLPESRSMDAVLKGVFNGTEPALNTRLIPVRQADPEETAKEIEDLGDVKRSREIAKYLGVKGPFNLNSTSVDAWRSVLMSLREREINGLQVGYTGSAPNRVATVSATSYENNKSTPVVRMGKPLASSTPPADLLWAGFRTLTDDQIDDLAKSIITEIQANGAEDSAPAFSLGEFVNRRPSSDSSVHSLRGLLQTAIDNSGINSFFEKRDSKDQQLSAAAIPARRKTGVKTPKAMDGWSAEGAPTMLTQGDLMMALAPVATVRGDTFKIRSYGEATTTSGTVLARAWCETVVQRSPDFVDPTEPAETPIASLSSEANRKFGRRFNIVSFRWLNENEL